MLELKSQMSKLNTQNSKLLIRFRNYIGNWKLEIGNYDINQRGYSIVELLVVITIFSIIAIIATQAVVLTLRGSRKGESLISVRENLDYAFAVMERQLRSARSVVSCDSDHLVYQDYERVTSDFSCQGGANGYIASGSARLTSSDVVVDCTQIVFACPTPTPGAAPSISIMATAKDTDSQGIEGSQVTTSTRIILRSY